MKRRFVLQSLPAALIAGPGLARAAGDAVMKIRDLYNKDLSFSDMALAHDGARVTFTGFMAPPLKAESRFFVLTKQPMSVCPFCETEAEWPDDIVAVYAKRTVKVIPFNVRIEVTGRLELGSFRDAETGFVSKVRIADAIYA